MSAPVSFAAAVDLLARFSHFIRHHGEAFARFSCTSRLNYGVQRKDVGLESDIVNYLDDLADIPGCLKI
jgi:hypothetical protein